MPLWLEILLLILLTYTLGFGIGWMIWRGRGARR